MGGEDFARSRVGKTLKERYKLDSLLGVGGMAAVYRGKHRNGNRVAIKVLHPELSINDDIRSRFLKEGYTANAVEHPGAVRVLDDDVEPDGTVFIVMELLEGETVDARWNRLGNRMPARDVLRMAYELLDILAAAHANGIVHRDIKPENLFFTRDDKVKVLDFGIARMRDGSAGSATLTANGRMMGSPAFMPREQALGLTKEIDGRTDVWALGATMFALLSSRFVHEAETVEGMIVATATQPPRALASVAPDVPKPVAEVVDRALAFERENRFPDARAMQAAVDDAHLSVFGERLGAVPAPTRAVAAAVAATVPLAPSTPVAPITSNAVSTTAGVTSAPPRALATARAAPAEAKKAGVPIGIVLGVVVVALAIGGTSVAFVLGRKAAPSAAAAAAAGNDAPGSGLVSSPLPPPPPTTASVAATTSVATEASAKPATTAIANRPATRPDTKPVAVVSPAVLSPSAKSPPAATPPVTTTATQPPAPSCDPWWYFDDQGVRHRKPECK